MPVINTTPGYGTDPRDEEFWSSFYGNRFSNYGGAATPATPGSQPKTDPGKGGDWLKALDPTTLLLGALSLFGGGGGGTQERESFTEPGAITDPKQSLYQALQGLYRTGQGLTERKPVKMRSSYVAPPPVAVNIPGIPFQIGGGLGRDPALDNPDLLTAQGNNDIFKYDPFQSVIPQKQGK